MPLVIAADGSRLYEGAETPEERRWDELQRAIRLEAMVRLIRK